MTLNEQRPNFKISHPRYYSFASKLLQTPFLFFKEEMENSCNFSVLDPKHNFFHFWGFFLVSYEAVLGSFKAHLTIFRLVFYEFKNKSSKYCYLMFEIQNKKVRTLQFVIKKTPRRSVAHCLGHLETSWLFIYENINIKIDLQNAQKCKICIFGNKTWYSHF